MSKEKTRNIKDQFEILTNVNLTSMENLENIKANYRTAKIL